MASKVQKTFKTIREQRPISQQEGEWHLPIHKRTAKEPHASMTVIRMNSTYLELVDGMYPNRGGMGMFGLFAIALFTFGLVGDVHTILSRLYWAEDRDSSLMLVNMISMSIFMLFCTGVVFAFLRRIGEWFGYTHYPIRLNRKNGMVYVWRGDGTVLEAPWNKVHFTLYEAKKVAGITWLGIKGLVLKDPKTVEEAFWFGYTSSERSYTLRYWEFLRRYMEDGPQAVINAPGAEYCL